MGATLKTALICAFAALALGAAHARQATPQRIISLLPSATETVCALGACNRLIGVDEFSLDPPQVRALPQLGKTWQPDIERIVALRPDLVLVGHVAGVIQRLQAAKIPYMVADATTMNQVHATLFKLDGVLKTQQADKVWQRMQQHVNAIASELKKQGGDAALKVYLEVDPAMYSAGPNSFMGQLLTRLGVSNIAPESATQFMRLSPEFVLRADPDLIILAHHGDNSRKLDERPGWQHMRAMQPQQRSYRVCQLTEDEARAATRPGPRLDLAAEVFANCIKKTRYEAQQKPR